MALLAPLFLFGVFVIGAPIVFHLIRRTTREVTPFSSLMFLQPTPPRVTRRSRLENLWLLALRCAVIALLAIGFARPYVKREADAVTTPTHAAARTVVLVDTSASMRREGLWPAARTQAEALLRQVAPEDEVALLTFDRDARTLLSFEQWKSALPDDRVVLGTAHLEKAAPTWAGTALGAALVRAAEMLESPNDPAGLRRRIAVVSDLQEGSRLDELQGFGWPERIEVKLHPVTPSQAGNASAHWVPGTEAAAQSANTTRSGPRVRISSAPDSRSEQLRLQWAGGSEASTLYVMIPPGQTRVLRAPEPPKAGAGELTLLGDEAAFDNTVFVAPPQPVRVPVLFLGKDAETDPQAMLFYLQRAFSGVGGQQVEVVARPGDQPVPAAELAAAQLLILGDGVTDPAIESAREFARGGKIVIFPATDSASGAMLAKLAGSAPVHSEEAPVKNYALLAQIDFQHPLFAPFADPRFSDFTKIHFWKYRRVVLDPLPGARVLARFDSGDPAVIQLPLGAGSVVVFATTWRPADGQLALSSKFVPLLYALLEQSSTIAAPKAQVFVGDEMPPPGAQPWTVVKPDGSQVSLAAGAKFNGADQPGIYTIQPGATRFVVNLSPEESRTAPLASERFTSLGVPLHRDAPAATEAPALSPAQAQAIELEARQKMWRWLIAAALVFLLCETLLAARLTRVSAALTTAPQTS